jgi:undecaprenyl diphosphate synthase
VQYLSVFVFSAENWKRSREEVGYLMDLGLWVAKHEIKAVHKEGVRIRFLGSTEHVPPKILKAIQEAEDLTKDNQEGTLVVCFNYGGQQELVDATRQIVAQGFAPHEITEDVLAGALYAPDIPPVDLLIRTSGEHRTSGFMLYRAAYAELYFTDKYWPDFTTQDFDEALAWYAARERRFGT